LCEGEDRGEAGGDSARGPGGGEFLELDEALPTHINEVTDRLIAEGSTATALAYASGYDGRGTGGPRLRKCCGLPLAVLMHGGTERGRLGRHKRT
jgi:hypothetical protein